MARTSTYLNFMGNTEEAFSFYKAAFKSEFYGHIQRMGSVPPKPGMPALTDTEKNKIMHIELPILGGHLLMGTDALESMGHTITLGTNVAINLEPDTREEADRLFKALSEGGKVVTPLHDVFWGAYFGTFSDKYGVRWMIHHIAKK